MDTFTTVTHQSWGSRTRNSASAACCGITFIPLTIWLLCWNEGNSVEAHKALHEAESLCMELPTIDPVEMNNNGKLVHLSGVAKAWSDVSDETFGVTLEDTLKLKRTTEMYQWKEHATSHTAKNTGGSTTTTTTYSYDKEWVKGYVNSQNFNPDHIEGHRNPTGGLGYNILAQDWTGEHTWAAEPIKVGAFTLSSSLTNKVNWFRPLDSTISIDNIPEETKENLQVSKYLNSGFYLGSGSQGNPSIGDVRISYSSVPSQTVSIVAAQASGALLSAYTTSSGRTVALMEPGEVPVDVMFVHANQQVTAMTWIFRLVGFVVLWISLYNISSPLSTLADVLPILGNILEGVNCVVSGLLALVIWTVTVALAWLFYRPFMSISLLAVAGGAIFYIYKRKRDARGLAVADPSGIDDLEMNEQNSSYSDKH